MRIGPDRHRLDGLATDLTEEFLNLLGIVHHDLLLLVLASPCTSCPSYRRLTHRVRVVKIILAPRHNRGVAARTSSESLSSEAERYEIGRASCRERVVD